MDSLLETSSEKAEYRSALYFAEGETKAAVMPPPYIFDICAPLIQENKDTTFSFVHVSVKEYLQTPESTVPLEEVSAQYEHAFASIVCLISAFEVLDPTYDTHKRNLRILGGLHAFNIHATQYWDEYLLSNCHLEGRPSPTSSLYSVASALATRLGQAGNSDLEMASIKSTALDPRMQSFCDDEEILRMLQTASTKRKVTIQGVPPAEHVPVANANLGIPRDLKELQAGYQSILRYLLTLPSYPGVSFEELEEFKTEFRTSAFTCFFGMCPRAASGFQDEATMLQHELTHTQTITCKTQGCQYPPFSSFQALKAHVAKCHQGTDRVNRATRIRTTSQAAKTRNAHDTAETAAKIGLLADSSGESSWNSWGKVSLSEPLHMPRQVDAVVFIRFSLCGKFLAVASLDWVRVYDTQTPVCVANIPAYASCVCFHPNANRLETGMYDGSIETWDMQTATKRSTYTHDGVGRITSIDIARQCDIMVSANDKTVCAWDTQLGIRTHVWTINGGVYCVAISSAGQCVVAVSADNELYISDLHEGHMMRTISIGPPRGNFQTISSLAFSPNLKYLFAGGFNGLVYSWDLQVPIEHTSTTTVKGHTASVISIAVTSDSAWVVSISSGGGIMLWNPQSGETQHISKVQNSSVCSVSVSSTGAFFATVSNFHEIIVWAVAKLEKFA